MAEKRLPKHLTRILHFLIPWKEKLVGVAGGDLFNLNLLVDGLQEAGYKVHLANTAAIKKYDGLKHSGDETDAPCCPCK